MKLCRHLDWRSHKLYSLQYLPSETWVWEKIQPSDSKFAGGMANWWIPSREGQRCAQCLEWAHPQLLEVTLDFLYRSGEVEGEPQATLSLQEQPIDINQSRWCIGTQRESATSKQTCIMSAMKTTSLSVAYKKHIYNQNNPLKLEDTSAFDPTELAGAKEGASSDFHMKLVNL